MRKLLKTWRLFGTIPFVEWFGGTMRNGAALEPLVDVTYGPAPAINAALGNQFLITVTDAVAFVIGAPTNPPPTGFAQVIAVTISNDSGGDHGAGTWNAAWVGAPTVLGIPDGQAATYYFRWDGGDWIYQGQGNEVLAPARQTELLTTVAYGPAPAINAALGNLFVVTVTDAVAFAVAAPTNPPAAGLSQVIVLTIRNGSGGAHGAGTWDAVFKTSGNVPAIADTKSRSFCFRWDGTNWVELWQTAADVAN